MMGTKEAEVIYDVIIVGGGIVGLATAYKISIFHPELKVLLLEKENAIAAHQTGRNSGVIHSGIYYKPGTFKAKNCVEGRRELVKFAIEHRIPHDICGKVIVATDPKELGVMDRIFNNGIQNGVEGIEKIDSNRITELEPACRGIAGLWVPCTGIIDYVAASEKMAEIVKSHEGNAVLTGYEATDFVKEGDLTSVITPKGNFKTRYLICCAGLQSDRMAKKDGMEPGMKVVGFRGDYYELTEKGMSKVKNLIYPVPNPEFPFLGVHFTRMIHGGVECGPNAVFVFKREGYGKTDFNLADTWDAISYMGTWKLFYKHWRFGLDEYRRAFSKRLFHSRLKRLIPGLEMDDIEPGRAGVRAMALDPHGDMIDDFKIVKSGNAIHILNAPSPAATAALAIGKAVEEMARENFHLK
jgi:L-2-hydroxyglutarate oxidase